MASRREYTADERARLLEWVRWEADMPWGPEVAETVADALGVPLLVVTGELGGLGGGSGTDGSPPPDV